MKPYDSPVPHGATADELLINTRVMGNCNHPDHTVDVEQDHGTEFYYAVCTKCGARSMIDSFHPRPPPPPGLHLLPHARPSTDWPPDILKCLVPHYAEDVVLARKVTRPVRN